jgi:hypothetical protein
MNKRDKARNRAEDAGATVVLKSIGARGEVASTRLNRHQWADGCTKRDGRDAKGCPSPRQWEDGLGGRCGRAAFGLGLAVD